MRVMTRGTTFFFYWFIDISHFQYSRHIGMTFQTEFVCAHQGNLRVIRGMRAMTTQAFSLLQGTMSVRLLEISFFLLMTGITQFSIRSNHTKRIRVCRWLMAGRALSTLLRGM